MITQMKELEPFEAPTWEEWEEALDNSAHIEENGHVAKFLGIEKARAAIEEVGASGKVFGVWFVKRTTGEMRHMTARLGVKKGVKGVGHKFDPRSRNLVGVYEMKGADESGFKFISLERVVQIKQGDKVFAG